MARRGVFKSRTNVWPKRHRFQSAGSPTAAAMWGASVTGIADAKLAALRLASLRAEGRAPSRNLCCAPSE
eukprot:2428936-Pyramimonas_sp.AAC.1